MAIPGTRRRIAPLLLLALVTLLAPGLFAAVALGAGSGTGSMEGVEGMSAEEMQNMATPTPTPSSTAMSGGDTQSAMPAMTEADGHGSAAAMDPNMDMGGGSVNWLVVGGFVVLIAGAALAAVMTKRHLLRRMRAGAVVGAGVHRV